MKGIWGENETKEQIFSSIKVLVTQLTTLKEKRKGKGKTKQNKLLFPEDKLKPQEPCKAVFETHLEEHC